MIEFEIEFKSLHTGSVYAEHTTVPFWKVTLGAVGKIHEFTESANSSRHQSHCWYSGPLHLTAKLSLCISSGSRWTTPSQRDRSHWQAAIISPPRVHFCAASQQNLTNAIQTGSKQVIPLYNLDRLLSVTVASLAWQFHSLIIQTFWRASDIAKPDLLIHLLLSCLYHNTKVLHVASKNLCLQTDSHVAVAPPDVRGQLSAAGGSPPPPSSPFTSTQPDSTAASLPSTNREATVFVHDPTHYLC